MFYSTFENVMGMMRMGNMWSSGGSFLILIMENNINIAHFT